MDSSQFLSYFWNLSNEHTNDQIIKSAESIVNLVEYEQKISQKDKEVSPSNLKYKLYLNICENPTEDLLYTMKRLVKKYFLIFFRLAVSHQQVSNQGEDFF